MDLPPTQANEPPRPGQAAPPGKGSSGLIDGKVQAPSETPDSGGVVAASQAESGELRHATQPHSTKDRNSLAEAIRRITSESGLVGNTRLAIEVDEDTNEPRFLILSRETGRVLRTVPNEDILPLLRELTQRQGAIVDRRV